MLSIFNSSLNGRNGNQIISYGGSTATGPSFNSSNNTGIQYNGSNAFISGSGNTFTQADQDNLQDDGGNDNSVTQDGYQDTVTLQNGSGIFGGNVDSNNNSVTQTGFGSSATIQGSNNTLTDNGNDNQVKLDGNGTSLQINGSGNNIDLSQPGGLFGALAGGPKNISVYGSGLTVNENNGKLVATNSQGQPVPITANQQGQTIIGTPPQVQNPSPSFPWQDVIA